MFNYEEMLNQGKCDYELGLKVFANGSSTTNDKEGSSIWLPESFASFFKEKIKDTVECASDKGVLLDITNLLKKRGISTSVVNVNGENQKSNNHDRRDNSFSF